MPSVVNICNMALGQLGSYRIESLLEATPQAQACSLYYEISRDAALRDYPWNFATDRVSLSQLTETNSEWDYVYAYPADCISALYIVNPYTADLIDFEIATVGALGARVILSDQESAELVYTALVTDPNRFDPLFIEALMYSLALKLCQPLKADRALKQDLANLYVATIENARGKDAREGHLPPHTKSDFVDARQ